MMTGTVGKTPMLNMMMMSVLKFAGITRFLLLVIMTTITTKTMLMACGG